MTYRWQRPGWKRGRHSLTGKLMMLYIGAGLLVVALIAISVSKAFHEHAGNRVHTHLVRYLEYVRADIGSPPSQAKADEIARRLRVEVHIFSSQLNWSSVPANRPILNAIEIHRQEVANGTVYSFGEYQDRGYLLSRNPEYTLAFSLPERSEPRQWARAVPIIILIIILFGLYHLTQRLFRPIHTIKTGVARIGQGELDHRIQIRRRDELGELADSVNTMADDLKRLLEAKRELLLAISHELRSPITRAKVSAEMMTDDRHREEIQHELNEMETLIEDLLETERLSTSHRVLNLSETSLDTLVRSVISNHFSDKSIELQLAIEPDLAIIDATRIRLLLRNLLDNALRHTPEGARRPLLSMVRENGALVLSVQDFGMGIEPEHLPHITEPFYRVDPARQRQTGGYGLGLYLCRVIAEAHGGNLEVTSDKGQGTLVKAILPVDPVTTA